MVIGHGTGFFSPCTALSPTPVKSKPSYAPPHPCFLRTEVGRDQNPRASSHGADEGRVPQSPPPASPSASGPARNGHHNASATAESSGAASFLPNSQGEVKGWKRCQVRGSCLAIPTASVPSAQAGSISLRDQVNTPILYSGTLKPLYNDTEIKINDIFMLKMLSENT